MVVDFVTSSLCRAPKLEFSSLTKTGTQNPIYKHLYSLNREYLLLFLFCAQL